MRVVPSGTNGTTSTAPMRGWAPVCCSMSISSIARPTAAVAARTTGSAAPAKVTTLRLWVSSREKSRSVTPSICRTVRTISSTTSARRPSEKFGTHSIRLGTRSSLGMAWVDR